jgi:hypothetical protein
MTVSEVVEIIESELGSPLPEGMLDILVAVERVRSRRQSLDEERTRLNQAHQRELAALDRQLDVLQSACRHPLMSSTAEGRQSCRICGASPQAWTHG